jgi:hypothetical protein
LAFTSLKTFAGWNGAESANLILGDFTMTIFFFFIIIQTATIAATVNKITGIRILKLFFKKAFRLETVSMPHFF